jgi:hypothetical protein
MHTNRVNPRDNHPIDTIPNTVGRRGIVLRIAVLLILVCIVYFERTSFSSLTETAIKFQRPKSEYSIRDESVDDTDTRNKDDTYGNYTPFNTTNPHGDSWCPYATCQNSPLCAPCNRRYILILATGRSGSTTLLKMMNFLPNVRLSGENRNFIGISRPLISNFQVDQGDNNNHNNNHKIGSSVTPLLDQNFDRDEGAFMHNAIPPQAMSCPIQSAFNVLNPPPKEIQENDHKLSIHEYDADTIMGCKTIRFHKNDLRTEYASNYLKEVFPCSKVIINIRSNAEDQVKSIQGTFQNGHHNKSVEDIDEYNTYLTDLAKELGSEMAKVIDLNVWKEDVEVFNDVVDWLGFKNCKFTSIIHENANGYDRDNGSNSAGLNSKCHYPH